MSTKYEVGRLRALALPSFIGEASAIARAALDREHVIVMDDEWKGRVLEEAVDLEVLRNAQILEPRPLPEHRLLPPPPNLGNRAARRAEASQRRRRR